MSSLDDVLTAAPDGDGWTLDVPDGWQQGRGAFGGLVLGAMTRALSAAAGDGRPLRSLSGAIFAAVVPGPARITVQALKAGNAVSMLRASLSQAGQPAAEALAVFGAARPETPSWTRISPPRAQWWTELPDTPDQGPPKPPFTSHFDLRPAKGSIFSGDSDGEVIGWVRPRAPALRRDAAFVVALIDCYYPVVLTEMTAPRPLATVTFHIELCNPLDGLDPEAPLLYRAVSPAARDGYVFEHRELWGSDGRLLALNQQVFVIIK